MRPIFRFLSSLRWLLRIASALMMVVPVNTTAASPHEAHPHAETLAMVWPASELTAMQFVASEVTEVSTTTPTQIVARDAIPQASIAVLTLLPGSARLSSMLSEFARENGWEIAWEIDRDFPIDYAARFEGPFLEIIGSVVASLRTTDAPIRAKVYRANKVVRIIHATR